MGNYLNLLDELKTLVSRNTQNKPSSPKKSSTPQHNKPLNRPKRRVGTVASSHWGAVLVVPPQWCTDTLQLFWWLLRTLTWLTVLKYRPEGSHRILNIIKEMLEKYVL